MGMGCRVTSRIDVVVVLAMVTCAGGAVEANAQAEPERQQFQAFGALAGKLPGSAGAWAMFSGDGKRILTGDLFEVRVWDSATLRPMTEPLRHSGGIIPLGDARISDNGKMVVTVGSDGTARIWDANTGAPLQVLRHRDDGIRFARFSPDATRILTGGQDGQAKLWDVRTGREMLNLPLRGNVIYAVFSPDGTKILTISDRPKKDDRDWLEFEEACLWDAATGHNIQRHNVVDAFWPQPAAFSPDGTKFVTPLDDKSVIVWDTRTGKHLVSVDAWTMVGETRVVSFGPKGEGLLTSAGFGVRLFSAQSGERIAEFKVRGDPAQAIFSPDGGRILTAGKPGQVELWDAANGKALGFLQLPGRPVKDEQLPDFDIPAIAFSPDGSEILVGDRVANVTTVWKLAKAPQK